MKGSLHIANALIDRVAVSRVQVYDPQSNLQKLRSYTTTVVLGVPTGLYVIEKPRMVRLSEQRSALIAEIISAKGQGSAIHLAV